MNLNEDCVKASVSKFLRKDVAVISFLPLCGSLARSMESASISLNGLHTSPSSAFILKRTLGPLSPNSIRSPS